LSAFWRPQTGRAPRPAHSQFRAIGGRRIIAEGLLHGGFWNDFYHNAMVISWPRFFAGLAAAFVSLNLFFAAVYSLGRMRTVCGISILPGPTTHARRGRSPGRPS
jgi:hypothetical protein